MPQRLLEGEYEEITPSPDIRTLQDEIARLEGELRQMRSERDRARAEGLAALSAIRALQALTEQPYRVLRAIRGEIEIVLGDVPAAVPVNGAAPAQPSGRWQNLMTKLGGLKAQFIQALLDYGPSTVTGIMASTGMSKQSVYNTALDLTKRGLITKNGSQYALKE